MQQPDSNNNTPQSRAELLAASKQEISALQEYEKARRDNMDNPFKSGAGPTFVGSRFKEDLVAYSGGMSAQEALYNREEFNKRMDEGQGFADEMGRMVEGGVMGMLPTGLQMVGAIKDKVHRLVAKGVLDKEQYKEYLLEAEMKEADIFKRTSEMSQDFEARTRIYEADPRAGFNMSSSYLANGMKSMISTAVPMMGIGWAASFAGRPLGLAETFGAVGAIGTAYGETQMMAYESYNETLRDLMDRGYSYEDARDSAKKVRDTVTNTYFPVMMAMNMVQMNGLIKGNSFLVSNMEKASLKQLWNLSKRKAITKIADKALFQPMTEALEEGFGVYSQNYAKNKVYSDEGLGPSYENPFTETFYETMRSPDAMREMVAGAFGGIGFSLAGKAFQHGTNSAYYKRLTGQHEQEVKDPGAFDKTLRAKPELKSFLTKDDSAELDRISELNPGDFTMPTPDVYRKENNPTEQELAEYALDFNEAQEQHRKDKERYDKALSEWNNRDTVKESKGQHQDDFTKWKDEDVEYKKELNIHSGKVAKYNQYKRNQALDTLADVENADRLMSLLNQFEKEDSNIHDAIINGDKDKVEQAENDTFDNLVLDHSMNSTIPVLQRQLADIINNPEKHSEQEIAKAKTMMQRAESLSNEFINNVNKTKNPFIAYNYTRYKNRAKNLRKVYDAKKKAFEASKAELITKATADNTNASIPMFAELTQLEEHLNHLEQLEQQFDNQDIENWNPLTKNFYTNANTKKKIALQKRNIENKIKEINETLDGMTDVDKASGKNSIELSDDISNLKGAVDSLVDVSTSAMLYDEVADNLLKKKFYNNYSNSYAKMMQQGILDSTTDQYANNWVDYAASELAMGKITQQHYDAIQELYTESKLIRIQRDKRQKQIDAINKQLAEQTKHLIKKRRNWVNRLLSKEEYKYVIDIDGNEIEAFDLIPFKQGEKYFGISSLPTTFFYADSKDVPSNLKGDEQSSGYIVNLETKTLIPFDKRDTIAQTLDEAGDFIYDAVGSRINSITQENFNSWFNSLSQARQSEIIGNTEPKYVKYEEGDVVTKDDFVSNKTFERLLADTEQQEFKIDKVVKVNKNGTTQVNVDVGNRVHKLTLQQKEEELNPYAQFSDNFSLYRKATIEMISDEINSNLQWNDGTGFMDYIKQKAKKQRTVIKAPEYTQPPIESTSTSPEQEGANDTTHTASSTKEETLAQPENSPQSLDNNYGLFKALNDGNFKEALTFFEDDKPRVFQFTLQLGTDVIKPTFKLYPKDGQVKVAFHMSEFSGSEGVGLLEFTNGGNKMDGDYFNQMNDASNFSMSIVNKMISEPAPWFTDLVNLSAVEKNNVSPTITEITLDDIGATEEVKQEVKPDAPQLTYYTEDSKEAKKSTASSMVVNMFDSADNFSFRDFVNDVSRTVQEKLGSLSVNFNINNTFDALAKNENGDYLLLSKASTAFNKKLYKKTFLSVLKQDLAKNLFDKIQEQPFTVGDNFIESFDEIIKDAYNKNVNSTLQDRLIEVLEAFAEAEPTGIAGEVLEEIFEMSDSDNFVQDILSLTSSKLATDEQNGRISMYDIPLGAFLQSEQDSFNTPYALSSGYELSDKVDIDSNRQMKAEILSNIISGKNSPASNITISDGRLYRNSDLQYNEIPDNITVLRDQANLPYINVFNAGKQQVVALPLVEHNGVLHTQNNLDLSDPAIVTVPTAQGNLPSVFAHYLTFNNAEATVDNNSAPMDTNTGDSLPSLAVRNIKSNATATAKAKQQIQQLFSGTLSDILPRLDSDVRNIYESFGIEEQAIIEFGTTDNGNATMDFRYVDGKPFIRINLDNLSNILSNEENLNRKASQILLHELLHQATATQLDQQLKQLKQGNNAEGTNALNLQDYLNTAINSANRRGLRNIGKPGKLYGLSNIHELVSETYSNPEFADFLKTVRYGKTNIFRKLFEDAVDFIRGLFNLGPITKKSNLNDAVISEATDIISKYDTYKAQRLNKQIEVDAILSNISNEVNKVNNVLSPNIGEELSQEVSTFASNPHHKNLWFNANVNLLSTSYNINNLEAFNALLDLYHTDEQIDSLIEDWRSRNIGRRVKGKKVMKKQMLKIPKANYIQEIYKDYVQTVENREADNGELNTFFDKLNVMQDNIFNNVANAHVVFNTLSQQEYKPETVVQKPRRDYNLGVSSNFSIQEIRDATDMLTSFLYLEGISPNKTIDFSNVITKLLQHYTSLKKGNAIEIKQADNLESLFNDLFTSWNDNTATINKNSFIFKTFNDKLKELNIKADVTQLSKDVETDDSMDDGISSHTVASYQINSKDRASANTKLFLLGTPKYNLTNQKGDSGYIGETDKTIYGTERLSDANALWTSMSTVLADTYPSTGQTLEQAMLEKLTSIGKYKPEFRNIVSRFNNLNTKQKHEFLQAFNNTSLEFGTVIRNKTENSTEYKHTLESSSAQVSKVLNQWKGNFMRRFSKVSDGNIVPNKDAVQQVDDSIKNFIKSKYGAGNVNLLQRYLGVPSAFAERVGFLQSPTFKNNDERYDAYLEITTHALNTLGINISKANLDYSINNLSDENNILLKTNHFHENYVSPLFSKNSKFKHSIYNFAKSKPVPIGTALTTPINNYKNKELIREFAFLVDNTMDASVRDSSGKSRYAISTHDMMSKTLAMAKNASFTSNFLNSIKQSLIGANSRWANYFSNYKQNFKDIKQVVLMKFKNQEGDFGADTGEMSLGEEIAFKINSMLTPLYDFHTQSMLPATLSQAPLMSAADKGKFPYLTGIPITNFTSPEARQAKLARSTFAGYLADELNRVKQNTIFVQQVRDGVYDESELTEHLHFRQSNEFATNQEQIDAIEASIKKARDNGTLLFEPKIQEFKNGIMYTWKTEGNYKNIYLFPSLSQKGGELQEQLYNADGTVKDNISKETLLSDTELGKQFGAFFNKVLSERVLEEYQTLIDNNVVPHPQDVDAVMDMGSYELHPNILKGYGIMDADGQVDPATYMTNMQLMVQDYLLNGMIANIESTKWFHGDLASYKGKPNNFFSDFMKRAYSIYSGGVSYIIDAAGGRRKYNSVTIADMELPSKFYTSDDFIDRIARATFKEAGEVQQRRYRVISGGQTGVDTIGLEIGRELGYETGGVAPIGFKTERGSNASLQEYGVREITQDESVKYGKTDAWTPRTEMNAMSSDMTVYFATNEDSAGRIATERYANKHGKVFLLNPTASQLRAYLKKNPQIQTINIAGNRGSKLNSTQVENIKNILREGLTQEVQTPPSLEQEKKRLREELEGYNEVNVADAQAWITLDRYREASKGFADWTEGENSKEDAYQAIKQWEKDKSNQALRYIAITKSIESGLGTTPLKTLHIEKRKDRVGNLKYEYNKQSEAVLNPIFIEGTSLQKLNDAMIVNAIDHVITQSGKKAGASGIERIHDNEGNLLDLGNIEFKPVQLSNDFYFKQLEVATKFSNGKKTRNLEASQIKKNALGGITEDMVFDTPFGDIKGFDIIDEMHKTSGLLSDRGLESLGVKDKMNKAQRTKFRKKLTDTQISSGGLSDNVKKALYNPEIPLDFIIQSSKDMMSSLFSMVNKSSVKTKMKGGSFVQQSILGLQDLTNEQRSNIIYLKDESNLNPPDIYLGEDGRWKVKPGQVLLPHDAIKHIPNWETLVENGDYETIKSMIDPESLELIGYRIPNQAKSSNDVLEVVGILPPSAGDTLVAYAEITTKTGSDFDIDKMYTLMPNLFFNKQTNKVEKIPVNRFDKTEQGLASLWDKRYGVKEAMYYTIDTRFKDKLQVTDEANPDNSFNEIKGSLEFTGRYTDEQISKMIDDGVITLDDFNKLKEEIDDQPTKEEFISANIEKDPIELNSTLALENYRFELYKAIFASPNTFMEVITPLDKEDLKKDINELFPEGEEGMKDGKFFSPTWQTIVRRAFMGGKFGVGQIANHLTFHNLARRFNLQYKPDIPIAGTTGDKMNLLNFSEIYNVVGEKKADVFSMFMNAFVDIAKDNYITRANYNLKTMPAAAFLIHSGIPLKTLTRFISHPVIKEYVRNLELNESRLGKPIDAREETLKAFGLDKYDGKKEYKESTLPYRLIFDDAESNNSKANRLEKQQSLTKGVDADVNDALFALATFNTFLAVGRNASDLSKAIGAFKFDTEGAGSSFEELFIKNDGLSDTLLLSGFTDSIQNMFYNSMLNKYKKNSSDFIQKHFSNESFLTRQSSLDSFFTAVGVNNISLRGKDGVLAAKEITKQLKQFYLSNIESGVFNNKEYFNDNELSNTLMELKETTPNLLLDILDVEYQDDGRTFIVANTQKGSTFEDNVSQAWLDLYSSTDPTIRDFAKELVHYSFAVSGFGSTRGSFHQFIPTELLQGLGMYDYVNTNDKLSPYRFVQQFFRNNFNDERFVPRISVAKDSNGETNRTVTLDSKLDAEFHDLTFKDKLDTPRIASYVNINGYPYVLVDVGLKGTMLTSATYRRTNKLGYNEKGRVIREYSANDTLGNSTFGKNNTTLNVENVIPMGITTIPINTFNLEILQVPTLSQESEDIIALRSLNPEADRQAILKEYGPDAKPSKVNEYFNRQDC